MIGKYLRYGLSASPKPNISFPYPFEHTLNPQSCQHLDPRFTQFQATQHLSGSEKQHICYTLKGLEQILNSSKLTSPSVMQYIDQRLISNINSFKEVMKEQNVRTLFQIDGNGCQQINGYLEIYGFNKENYIHQYEIQRKDDKLMLTLKKKNKEKLTMQQQIQNDIKQIEKDGSLGEKFKEELLKKDKKRRIGTQFVFKIADMFKRSHQNYKSSQKFQAYHLINSISTSMSVQFNSFEGKSEIQSQKIENVNLLTKWYYEVTSQEPESVRKSRKRILFDIQLWRRGCMLPIKNFVEN